MAKTTTLFTGLEVASGCVYGPEKIICNLHAKKMAQASHSWSSKSQCEKNNNDDNSNDDELSIVITKECVAYEFVVATGYDGFAAGYAEGLLIAKKQKE